MTVTREERKQRRKEIAEWMEQEKASDAETSAKFQVTPSYAAAVRKEFSLPNFGKLRREEEKAKIAKWAEESDATYAQTAEKFGKSMNYVREALVQHGVTPKQDNIGDNLYEAIAMYLQGKSMQEIAEKQGRTHQAVASQLNKLKKHGVSFKSVSKAQRRAEKIEEREKSAAEREEQAAARQSEIAEILREYCAGDKIADIAERRGVSQPRISEVVALFRGKEAESRGEGPRKCPLCESFVERR